MQTLVNRFRNAAVAGFKRPRTILALLLIVLAFLVSVKQRRGPKMRLAGRAHITTLTGVIKFWGPP